MISVISPVTVRSVLLATDFSQASAKPLRHALAVARYWGAKFYLTHVVSSVGLTMAGPDAIAAAEQAVCRDAAQLEDDLSRRGALAGVQHEIIIRHGEIWPELKSIIRQENIDLVVIGTHGRHGIGKLLLGSVAEQIFRHADCMVVTVGPSSYEEFRVGSSQASHAFLFATDFSEGSLHALPTAAASANQFGAKLVLLNVVPINSITLPEPPSWCTADDVLSAREKTRRAALRQLEGLTHDIVFAVNPEFHVQFESGRPISETILDVSRKLRVDAIIMGLNRSKHIGTASHMPWATAYEVVCNAQCPVLTVRK